MNNNQYRKLWENYALEIEELKASYNHFSDQNAIKTAKLAIAYLNYLFGSDTIRINTLPFEIDYLNIKILDVLNLVIFYSQKISDYQKIIDECKVYMEEMDMFAYEGVILESIEIPAFSAIANELGQNRDVSILELSKNEYLAVIGGISDSEQLTIARIENAKEYKFETIYYDLNEGDDNGAGLFFCCYLTNEPKQCQNVRFFCKQYKTEFLSMTKEAEKFFY